MTSHFEISKKIEKVIASEIANAKNGSFRTQYISYYVGEEYEEVLWKIRISNHAANPDRTDSNTISFVINIPQVEEEEYSSLCTNKKTFKISAEYEYFLNENGSFEENYENIEECLNYIIS